MFRRLLGLTAVLLFLAACTQPAPPVVSVAVSPAAGASDVAVSSVVTATFSVAMDEDTLDDVFTLTATGGAVPGAQSYDAAQRRLTFTPDADLAYGTEYTASLARSVRSTAGGRLAGEATGLYSWTFTTEAEPEETGEVTSVTVVPSTAEVELGDTLQLTATVVADDGVDASVTWSSSDEAVATVSASGLVTAVAGGTATITATSVFDATVSGNAAITVLAPAVTSVSVTPAQAAILTDGTQQFLADVVGVSGASLAVTWSSSDLAVATVSETGLVTAVAAGTTTITATSVVSPSVSGTAELTVSDVPVVTAITLDPATTELEIGETVELTPAVAAAGGADESVVWDSSDPTVATVVDGAVTAVGAGSATITATSVFNPSVVGSAAVTVLAEAVTGVVVDPAEVTIAVGDADVQFTATVTAVSGASEEVTWSSDDPAVALVDADGLVSAVAAGTATITATSVFDAAVSGSATVNVPGVTDVDVTPGSADLTLTGTVQLLATVTAVHGEADESVTWSSSDPDVATVSETGLVSAVATGSVTITATSVATPSTYGAATVDVHSEVVAADYVSDAGYLDGAVLDLAPPVVSGGLAPYTYTMSAGLLPSGVTLNPDGSISGTATGAADYFGTVTVSDDLGQTATADFRFSIVTALELNLYLDDTLTVDTEFAPQSLIAAGGLAPFTIEAVIIDPEDPEWADRYDDGTWSTHLLDEQGALAPGLDANADTGVVSGTVTAIGFHRTYLRVTDALGQTDVVQLEIVVEAAPLVLTYSPAAYAYQWNVALVVPEENVTVTGGVAPYAFSWSRESCQYGPICVDNTWHLDGATGVIEHDAVQLDWFYWDLGHRTYRVTVTDAMGATATFDVVFNEL